MGEAPFKPLKYKCPICGKRAVFGTHHCEVSIEEKTEPLLPSAPSPVKYYLSVLVALVLIIAFLWEMVGSYSLLALIVLPLGIIVYRIFMAFAPRLPSGDYRSLLRMSGGDKEAAERLIALEGVKHPGKARKDLIKNILVQWRRDLR
jgi:hypothetical protein